MMSFQRGQHRNKANKFTWYLRIDDFYWFWQYFYSEFCFLITQRINARN